jgi:uncharacterized membrane protein YhiD involved in acid resistance
MNQELANAIMKAVISIVSVLITVYLIPWLKKKIGEQNYSTIIQYITLAVNAAEQLYTEDQWAEKKKYVENYASDICQKAGIAVTAEQLDAMIEGIVHEVKHSDGEVTMKNAEEAVTENVKG